MQNPFICCVCLLSQQVKAAAELLALKPDDLARALVSRSLTVRGTTTVIPMVLLADTTIYIFLGFFCTLIEVWIMVSNLMFLNVFLYG